MAGRAKGDQEILYFGPGQLCGGIDYSLPYNCLPPNSLADGTLNTSQINGFVTSAPWLANAPFQTSHFAANEFTMGIFEIKVGQYLQAAQFLPPLSYFIIVTNIAVYQTVGANVFTFPTLSPGALQILHTWAVGEIQPNLIDPGNAVSFVEVNGVVYFTGLMLNGIFSVNLPAGNVFAQATNYLCAAYIAELGGRLIAAQCRFPGGGGTGTNILPTVAWSGPGEYAGSGASDPWNPANGFGGGFNLLADVPDQVTGLAGMGRSAIIFREQGLSQCDPNSGPNAGLQPFNFYHLWASPQGIGAIKGSVAQYGYTVNFLSSDNVYSMNLYNGPQPIGPKIIPKIIADNKAAAYNEGIVGGGTVGSGSGTAFWYYGSVVNVSGQLHYLLTFSSYVLNAGPQTQKFNAIIYDCNLSENAWHFTNLNTYLSVSGTSGLAQAFSCPIFQGSELQGYFGAGANQLVNFAPSYILCGYISNFGTAASFSQTGTVGQLVFWDYNFNSNPYNSLCGPLYPPFAIPISTLVFRGDIIALGHRTSNRRLRVQADNAPMPSFVTNSQQQAKVFFTGSLPNNTSNAFLAWTQGAGPSQPVPYMQGNYAPQGAPMQTYYADLVLEDEMIQSSIQSFINDPQNPWNSLPAFRISSVSLITMDPKSTTQ